MQLIDTHCHFNLPPFAADYPEAVRRAMDAGISDMVVVGCDVGSSLLALEMAEKYDCLWAAVGIHPCDAQDATAEAVDQIAELAAHPRVVAIGESGLDFVCDGPSRQVQRTAFEEFINMAADFDKAFIIHSRQGETNTEVLELLAQTKSPQQRVVRHCFTEDTALLNDYIAQGCYISIAGNVTYPGNQELREAVKAAPADRIVLETDCPGLPPQSHRGKRNEPALMVETAAKIAQVRGVSIEAIVAQTTKNAWIAYGQPI